MSNLLTSPVGEIQFMAAETPVKGTNDKMQYSTRLIFDSKKDAKFLKEISAINDALVVTADTYRGKNAEVKALLATGKSQVNARSNYKPNVYDKEGNELEEAPAFYTDSTGQAQMIVQPYTGSSKGGTINLVAVIVHNIESPESSSGTDRETRRAQLQALVDAATK